MAIAPDSGKSVTILGSTGSIGLSTVETIIASRQSYTIDSITAKNNVSVLAQQARQLGAKCAVISDECCYKELKEELSDTNIRIEAGKEAIDYAASRPSDIVMSAIVGADCLRPTMEAIRRGAKIALANKECLVCAGELMIREIKQHNATLIPVDSEHNAIFQIFDFECPTNVAKITLTASGGPFRGFTTQQLKTVTLKEAIKHPTWQMGNKISIDSATMMNKGLELIEAYYLFPVGVEQIEIIVHPESIIHSMVEYIDGSLLAQMGRPDMKIPISYALAWPKREENVASRLDLAKVGQLTFEKANDDVFKSPKLAVQALKTGGTAPAILNSVNEVAVEQFVEGNISFLDITNTVEEALNKKQSISPKNLDDIYACIEESKRLAYDLVKGRVT